MINESDLAAWGYYEASNTGGTEKSPSSLEDMAKEYAKKLFKPIGYPYTELLDVANAAMITTAFDNLSNAESKQDTLLCLAAMILSCYDFSASFGWELDEAIKRVHKSRMGGPKADMKGLT